MCGSPLPTSPTFCKEKKKRSCITPRFVYFEMATAEQMGTFLSQTSQQELNCRSYSGCRWGCLGWERRKCQEERKIAAPISTLPRLSLPLPPLLWPFPMTTPHDHLHDHPPWTFPWPPWWPSFLTTLRGHFPFPPLWPIPTTTPMITTTMAIPEDYPPWPPPMTTPQPPLSLLWLTHVFGRKVQAIPTQIPQTPQAKVFQTVIWGLFYSILFYSGYQFSHLWPAI